MAKLILTLEDIGEENISISVEGDTDEEISPAEALMFQALKAIQTVTDEIERSNAKVH